MKSEGGGLPEFDRFLEHELTRRVGRLSGPSPLPYQAAFRRGGRVMSLASVAAAAASSKAAAALAAAALIAGGGSVAATAATGSANPAVWGRTVTSAVASCKAGQGQHGIGLCVSAIAKTHGQQERAAHAQGAPSPAPTAHATAAPTAPAHPDGRPTTLPTPAQSVPGLTAGPTPHPTGKPSAVPSHGK